MIRHIALFQFDEEKATQSEMESIKADLEKLVDIIPELINMEVGLNMNPAEKQHLVLTADTKDMKDLDIYANHPEHKKVGARIRAIIAGRTCVDYEI